MTSESDLEATARDIRTGYVAWCRGEVPESQAAADFDRFIARVKAEVLREAAESTRGEALDEPYAGALFTSYAEWLDDRADRIEKGAGL